MSDIRSAVRFMRKRGAAYGGNPENIFLLGGSAGAHISMLAGYHGEEFDDAADDLTVSADVSGVIELYGPADMTKVIRDTRERVQKEMCIRDSC